MKTMKALGVALVAAGSLMALPAMADPDLEGAIQAGECPPGPDSGSVTVLGKLVKVPFGTPITIDGKPALCSAIAEGDRVKVGCTDATCEVASYVKVEAASTESALADVFCEGQLGFYLANGIYCSTDFPAEVKQDKKKNLLGLAIPSATATLNDFYNFVCRGTTGYPPGVTPIYGTTPGTLEIKCTGYDPFAGAIIPIKIEVKK